MPKQPTDALRRAIAGILIVCGGLLALYIDWNVKLEEEQAWRTDCYAVDDPPDFSGFDETTNGPETHVAVSQWPFGVTCSWDIDGETIVRRMHNDWGRTFLFYGALSSVAVGTLLVVTDKYWVERTKRKRAAS